MAEIDPSHQIDFEQFNALGDAHRKGIRQQQQTGQHALHQAGCHFSPHRGQSVFGTCRPADFRHIGACQRPSADISNAANCRYLILFSGVDDGPQKDRDKCGGSESAHKVAGNQVMTELKKWPPTRRGHCRKWVTDDTARLHGLPFFYGNDWSAAVAAHQPLSVHVGNRPSAALSRPILVVSYVAGGSLWNACLFTFTGGGTFAKCSSTT